jgi:DNA invertase Pin-like site-specific DNA recombinase
MNEPDRRPDDSKNDRQKLAGAKKTSHPSSRLDKTDSHRPSDSSAVPRGAIRAVLYYRVSTSKQDEANQIPELHRFAEFRRWHIVKEYIDHGVSGAKDSRRDLDQMMHELRHGRYDVLLVYSYDRFARSLPHLVMIMDELGKLGVGFKSLMEDIDTTTPQGRLIFAVYAGLAEWQRFQTAHKTRAALQRKRDAGIKLGRPEVPQAIRDKVLELRKQGLSLSAIASQVTWVRSSGKYGDRKVVTISKSMVGKIVATQETSTKPRQNVA